MNNKKFLVVFACIVLITASAKSHSKKEFTLRSNKDLSPKTGKTSSDMILLTIPSYLQSMKRPVVVYLDQMNLSGWWGKCDLLDSIGLPNSINYGYNVVNLGFWVNSAKGALDAAKVCPAYRIWFR